MKKNTRQSTLTSLYNCQWKQPAISKVKGCRGRNGEQQHRNAIFILTLQHEWREICGEGHQPKGSHHHFQWKGTDNQAVKLSSLSSSITLLSSLSSSITLLLSPLTHLLTRLSNLSSSVSHLSRLFWCSLLLSHFCLFTLFITHQSFPAFRLSSLLSPHHSHVSCFSCLVPRLSSLVPRLLSLVYHLSSLKPPLL